MRGGNVKIRAMATAGVDGQRVPESRRAGSQELVPERNGEGHRREALSEWALDLIAPTEGSERTAFASYRVVAAAVGVATIKALIDAGLVDVWDLGCGATLTPWGHERGKLLVLTPLGAQSRALELAERTVRCVVAERVRSRRAGIGALEVRMGTGEIPYWQRCGTVARNPGAPGRRRAPRSDDWLALIVDPGPRPDEL
jgi:hypothetical protein